MSVGSFMIHAPISQPAPQPSPCEPSPTADGRYHSAVYTCRRLIDLLCSYLTRWSVLGVETSQQIGG